MTRDQRAQGTSGEAFSREVRDFLVQFAIGVHRHGIYPDGHPSLEPSVEAVLGRVSPLLAERGTLALGVARGQLIIEGVATDIRNVVVTDLAARLHRHHVGALVLHEGLTGEECREFFRAIARDPDRTGEHAALDPDLRRAWPHVRLHPVNYARLRLAEGSENAVGKGEADRAQRTRAAELWVGLARAALASGDDILAEAELTPAHTDPAILARAISDHSREASYDQSIIGFMLQIADTLSGEQTPESAGLRARVSRLISAMDGDALRDLLQMGGDTAQRRRFLLTATEGIAAEAVIDLVRAASEGEEGALSHSLLRMLKKLARHAGTGGARQSVADMQIREQITKLVSGWSLKNPNPGAYGEALRRLASDAVPTTTSPAENALARDPRHLVQMAVEIGAWGAMVQEAADRAVSEGGLPWILTLVKDEPSSPMFRAVHSRYVTAAHVAGLLSTDPIDTTALDDLVQLLGLAAAPPMLDALAQAEGANIRPLLLSRLAPLGPALGPLLVARLEDERWYVTRNMLHLLDKLPELPPGFDPLRWTTHGDARIRREAFRLVLRDPDAFPRAVTAGLRDPDEMVVHLAIRAATRHCPVSALPVLASLATTATDPELRTAAIRALGRSRLEGALPVLLRLTEPRRWLLWRRLPPKTPDYLAALAGLARFPHNARAVATLAAAARSRDPEVIRATQDTSGREPLP